MECSYQRAAEYSGKQNGLKPQCERRVKVEEVGLKLFEFFVDLFAEWVGYAHVTVKVRWATADGEQLYVLVAGDVRGFAVAGRHNKHAVAFFGEPFGKVIYRRDHAVDLRVKAVGKNGYVHGKVLRTAYYVAFLSWLMADVSLLMLSSFPSTHRSSKTPGENCSPVSATRMGQSS